jgi:hypothetical protein
MPTMPWSTPCRGQREGVYGPAELPMRFHMAMRGQLLHLLRWKPPGEPHRNPNKISLLMIALLHFLTDV